MADVECECKLGDDDAENADSCYDDGRPLTNDTSDVKPVSSTSIPSPSLMEDRCELVSRAVLLPLRLEIVAKKSSTKKEDGAATVDVESEALTAEEDATIESTVGDSNQSSSRQYASRTYYSSTSEICTAHPRWDHLNENLLTNPTADTNEADREEKWKDQVYPSLYARFVVVPSPYPPNTTQQQHSSKKNNNKDWILAEVPLHPSHLRCIPLPDDARSISSSNSTMNIPSSLPPNAILIHYTDGYTRVLPSLYELLVQKGIVEKNASGVLNARYGSADDGCEGGDKGREEARFDEKVFDVLGEGGTNDAGARDATATTTDEQPEEKGTNSVYVDAKVFDLLGKENTAHASTVATTTSVVNEKNEFESAFDDCVFDLVGGESAEREVLLATSNDEAMSEVDDARAESTEAEESVSYVIDTTTDSCNIEPVQPNISSPSDSEPSQQLLLPSKVVATNATSTVSHIKDEVEELRKMVQHEQTLLEKEQQLISWEANYLKTIMSQVQQLQDETIDTMKAVGVERTNLFKSNFRLESHRIRLLRQLQLVFPIRLCTLPQIATSPQQLNHQYTIAGLALPDDVHNSSSTDDQVSMALGLTCHLVSLTSKYLSIPLRYRMVCKFSRSAIIDELGRGGMNGINNKSSAVIYPLFRERGVVDPLQLEYGLVLLTRDVDCLLRTRRVEYHRDWNVLAKMDRLMKQIIGGGRS
eukprot:scaffold845_cov199-Alexandrium_tamarense.AAC.12